MVVSLTVKGTDLFISVVLVCVKIEKQFSNYKKICFFDTKGYLSCNDILPKNGRTQVSWYLRANKDNLFYYHFLDIS